MARDALARNMGIATHNMGIATLAMPTCAPGLPSTSTFPGSAPPARTWHGPATPTTPTGSTHFSLQCPSCQHVFHAGHLYHLAGSPAPATGVGRQYGEGADDTSSDDAQPDDDMH